MHCPRFKECLVLLVVFHPSERSSKMNTWHSGSGVQQHPPELPGRCAYTPCAYDYESFDPTTPLPNYSLDDFLEDYGMYYGDDWVTPSIWPPTPPPSTPEPSSSPNPYKFYIDQLKKKSDSNQKKKLHDPVECLQIKLNKLVEKFVDWIENLPAPNLDWNFLKKWYLYVQGDY